MTDRDRARRLSFPRYDREDARRLFDVVRLASRDLVFRSPIPRLAAALAFRTIFGLIPVVVIGLAVLGEVVSDERLEQEVSRLLSFTGITNIVIQPTGAPLTTAPDSPGLPPPAPSDPATTPSAGGQPDPDDSPSEDNESGPAGENPDALLQTDSTATTPAVEAEDAARLDEWIQATIDRIRQISLRAVGIAGGAVLVYAAIALLRDIEQSFNLIYRARRGRSWWHRFTLYWTTISLGMFLLVGVFYLGDLVARQITVGIISRGLVEFLIATVITTGILTMGYVGMPNTRVHVRAALAGGFIAAIGWQIIKWGFKLYVSRATGYGQLYGEIGLLPIFLLWVYATWVIILFGLQVTFAVQNFSVWREQIGQGEDEKSGLADPHAVVAVAALVAHRFRSGKTLATDDAAELLGLRASEAAELIDRLESGGFIHRVEPEGDSETVEVTLARPPEEIPVASIMSTMHEGPAKAPVGTESAPQDEREPEKSVKKSPEAAVFGALRTLRAAQDRAWAGWTLADLAAGRSPAEATGLGGRPNPPAGTA